MRGILQPDIFQDNPKPVLGICLKLILVTLSCSPGLIPVYADDKPQSGAHTAPSISYQRDIQPILNRRCIACHGCLGSPCNVKLDSYRAVDRGGMGMNPYSLHLKAYQRTGMDVVQTTAEWRKRGFYPILPKADSSMDEQHQSLLFQVLEQGYSNNQPGFPLKALLSSYKNRYDHQCPTTPAAEHEFLKGNPAAGMPYGLPAISEEEFNTLSRWIEKGAPGPTPEELQVAGRIDNPHAVAQWEQFFNRTDKRTALVMRYIFDHMYAATIVLDESPGDFFRLVRSKTPPGSKDAEQSYVSPIEIIDTPYPYDDPYKHAKVDRFYYRLRKITTPIVQKNHFTWQLGLSDINALETLFLKRPWIKHAKLDPPWGDSNPFRVFQAIPAKARYRFMLENSEVIVGAITYGPVCLGETATYAVKDHFWVFFIDPEHDVTVRDPKLGLKTWDDFMGHDISSNDDYEAAYAKALARLTPKGYSIDAIWDGGQTNRNAWLTVLRHESNTSVMKGPQGGFPPTFWLMSYSGFERIYYDTVASFQYWGSDLSKIDTLLFFNYLRQEFEDNFLLLLPEKDRGTVRTQWTQGIGGLALEFFPFAGQDQPTQVPNNGKHPLVSLLEQVRTHMGKAISGPSDSLNPRLKPRLQPNRSISDYDDWEHAIAALTITPAYKFSRYLPSVTLLKLNHDKESRLYSLVANRKYASHDTLFFQNGTELLNEYTMSVYPTLIGGFPNLFIELDLEQAADFLTSLKNIDTLDEWIILKYKYAILRNSAEFWPMYDWFHAWNIRHRGVHAGYLDLSYYDLFDSIY